MHFACWIATATDARSEHVILIAFPQQQWLRERASMLRRTNVACLIVVRSVAVFLERTSRDATPSTCIFATGVCVTIFASGLSAIRLQHSVNCLAISHAGTHYICFQYPVYIPIPICQTANLRSTSH
jgi:hypothetical protein